MDFKVSPDDIRNALKDKYDRLPILKQYGTLDQLSQYLEEEISELERQKLLNDTILSLPFIPDSDGETKNPHNILAYSLLGFAEYPKILNHHWIEGDYPDIDVDFDPDSREQILSWLQDKYGHENVMKAATWGMSGLKGSILDLSKVVSKSIKDINGKTKNVVADWKDVQAITKEIDNIRSDEDEDITIDIIKEKIPGAKELFRDFPELRQWAEPYGKVIRNSGQHAGAVVICSEPLEQFLPIIKSSKGDLIIGLSESGSSGKKELQPQGVIKYDFLGLSNVRILADTEKLVSERNPKLQFNEATWNKIGFDHSKVYQLACAGELDGIFQFEQGAGKRTTKEVQPKSFSDLVFVNAGMRPGAAAANAAKTYHDHMIGIKNPDYPDHKELSKFGINEELIKFLDQTHGIIAYQEQIQLFLHHAADFTLAETNKIRKAITTTNPKAKEKLKPYMDKVYNQYIDAIMKKGMSQSLAEKWWDTVVGQAEYSFNLCLALDNMVLTINGYKKINEIKIGDIVLSWNEKDKIWFWNEVIDVINSGIKEVWQAEFDNGSIVNCTLDHKFITLEGEISLYDLKLKLIDSLGHGFGPKAHEIKLVKLRFRGFEPTMDLETRGIDNYTGHNFIANGAIVSNSHSASYALIAFRQLFFKAYFPTEFFITLISNTSLGKKKYGDEILTQYISAAYRFGIKIEGTDINQSQSDVSIIENKHIIMGFNHIKYCGDKPAEDIVRKRPENGYNSFDQFIQIHKNESSVNKRIIESLIKVGAFDKIENKNRSQLLDDYLESNGKPKENLSYYDILMAEQEYSGFIFTETPLSSQSIIKKGYTPLENAKFDQNKNLYLGVVTEIMSQLTKTGKIYHKVKLSNLKTEVLFFAWDRSGVDKLNIEKGDGLVVCASCNDQGYLSLHYVKEHLKSMWDKLEDAYRRKTSDNIS